MAAILYHNFITKAMRIGESQEDNGGIALLRSMNDDWDPDAGTPAGDGMAFRFKAPVASKISEVLFHIDSHSGTDIQVDVRSAGVDDDTYGSIVGGGSQDHTIVLGGGSNGWESESFTLSAPLTRNDVYWITIGIPPQGGGKTVDMTLGSPVAWDCTLQDGITAYAVTHPGGSRTVTKCSPMRVGAIVIKFEDGTVIGCPYAKSEMASVIHGNDVERGLDFETGVTPLDVVAVAFMGHANINKLRIYAAATAPGGTPLYTVTPNTDGAVGFWWIDQFTFKAGVGYRLAFDVSAACACPSVFQVSNDTGWNGNQTALQACCFGGSSIYYTYESAGPAWTDLEYGWPYVALILGNEASGGTNRGILTGGRM